MAGQSLHSTSADQALTIDDLAELENNLQRVAHKSTAFGLQLGVNHPTIQAIQVQYANPYDQLREILSYRLRQLPPLTWLDVIQALRSNGMQENRLASEIESQYLSVSASSQVTRAHSRTAPPSAHHSGSQSTLQPDLSTPNTQPHPPPQPDSPIPVHMHVHVSDSSSQPPQPAHPQKHDIAPKKHDWPSLPLLLEFPSNAGNVNVMECIGTNYEILGTLLLNDNTGAITAAIVDECRRNAFRINYQILQQWIQGRGRQPVTWDTLVGVLRSIKLSELASTIENVLS